MTMIPHLWSILSVKSILSSILGWRRKLVKCLNFPRWTQMTQSVFFHCWGQRESQKCAHRDRKKIYSLELIFLIHCHTVSVIGLPICFHILTWNTSPFYSHSSFTMFLPKSDISKGLYLDSSVGNNLIHLALLPLL